MDEQDYLNALGDHVKQISGSLGDLESRYKALRDNPKDRSACRESIRTVGDITHSIEAAKDLKRKYALWQSGQPDTSKNRLRREKLQDTLDTYVKNFNDISSKLARITEDASGARAVSTTTGSPSAATTSSSQGRGASSSPSIGMLPNSLHEQSECIQKVHQGIEATQQIFDELGSLVQRQAPHLDMLENSNTDTKHYSQEAANELQKEYRRRQRRARHLWTIFVMIVCTMFLMLYLYVRAPQGSNIITPSAPEANIPPLQQQPALELESSLTSSNNGLLILRGSQPKQQNR